MTETNRNPAGDDPTIIRRPGDTSSSGGVAAAAKPAGSRPAVNNMDFDLQAILSPGTVLGGRYEIIEVLGLGGMGAVYKASDRELDRTIALKVIRPSLANNPEILARFKQELLTARQVTHRNVIRIFDIGEADGIRFITMEYVVGKDLRSILAERGKLSPEEAVRMMQQVCAGIAAAHAEGVIHRDLKPGNVMCDEQGRVTVMDFGLARSLQTDSMTQTGALLGTVEYMSPEQARAEKLDARSDLYTIGLILYELLTGQTPFKAESVIATLLKRSQERATPVVELDPAIPASLSEVVSRCIEPDPNLRFQSVQELIDKLDEIQGRRPPSVYVPAPSPRATAKRKPWLLIGAIALVVAGLVAAVFLYSRWRSTAAPVAYSGKTMTVLLADFKNLTSDNIFEGTLEPAFGLALEGASFISTYNRSQARTISNQIKPGASLDDAQARLVAAREGINVVISGAVEAHGGGYKVSCQAADALTGKVIAREETLAADKSSVLKAVGKLAGNLRTALGDTTPESVKLAQQETYTTESLAAAHEYALAQDLQWAGSWNEAAQHYQKAVELDPKMGRAYAGLAAISANTGHRNDAEKYYRQAMALVDRMSDREKYRTRGGYYLMVREPQKAVEEYSALIKQFPADASGYGNLALAYFYARDMQKAVQEGRHAVQVSPKNLLQRANLALYAVYAGDFAMGAQEAQTVLDSNPSFVMAENSLAMAQMGLGQTAEAGRTFQKLQHLNARGESMAAVGFADIALFQGQPDEATTLLDKAAQADIAAKDNDGAAAKYIMLAQAHLLAGHAPQAKAAAEKAVGLAKSENVLYPAGQIYLETGALPAAAHLAWQLSSSIDPEPQVYGKLLEGEVALKRKDARQAISLFREAQKMYDTWLVHYDLGRAYLDAGRFTEADSEFELCLRRKGEASAIFLDDVPTFRIIPALYYYLGRAQEGLNSPAAQDSYKTFISYQEKGVGPLLSDARRRVSSH